MKFEFMSCPTALPTNGSQIIASNDQQSNHFALLLSEDNLTHNYVTTSYATYKPRTENDYGQLLCIARNAIGKQEAPCAFTLVPGNYREIFNFLLHKQNALILNSSPPSFSFIGFAFLIWFFLRTLFHPFFQLNFQPNHNRISSKLQLIFNSSAGSPDPLRACSVRNVTDHSVIVGCLPGYDGGLKQRFVLSLQELTADQLTSTHQHLLNKHLMDQNKYPSILTTEELEDFNEISSVNSLDKSVVDKLDSGSKSEKGSRKRAKSKSPKQSGSNLINLLEEKAEAPQFDEQLHSSKESEDQSNLSELNQNALTDQGIDLEPGGSLNLTSERAQFYVKGLRSGSTYLCTLHAVNSRGISRAVVLVAQTLAAPESMNRMGDGEYPVFRFFPSVINKITRISRWRFRSRKSGSLREQGSLGVIGMQSIDR